MIVKKSLAIVLSCFCFLLASSSAFACACCVDPGYYEISTAKPNAYELAYLADIKFDLTAQLYESVAGFDAIRGLDDLKKDEEDGKSIDLSVVETFTGKVWQLNIKTANGRSGSLVLPMPLTRVKFKVDQHDNEPGTETSLYKELRFKGVVRSGTGIFKPAIVKPTSFFLVFQGHGNGCDSSADFNYWRLELDGPKAAYAFFGKLNS